jgi:acyl-coenzyme A thioesterase PaaI-like protein
MTDYPHFFSQLGFDFEVLPDDRFVGRATVQPNLCVPGTAIPRPSMLATYADIAIGFPAANRFTFPAPTLDLSMHVFRTPSAADLTMEAKLVKIGRRVIVGECWFTAAGEDDPYAVCVATFFTTADPMPAGWSTPRADNPMFSPTQDLPEPIVDRAGIVMHAPGSVEVSLLPHISNGTTIQGGIVALLVERACESALGDAYEEGEGHVVTGLDLRYLSGLRVGPARATARPLRSDEQGSHLWVDVTDAGDDDRLMVHCLATARPLHAV